jgi:hypothetical protein
MKGESESRQKAMQDIGEIALKVSLTFGTNILSCVVLSDMLVCINRTSIMGQTPLVLPWVLSWKLCLFF